MVMKYLRKSMILPLAMIAVLALCAAGAQAQDDGAGETAAAAKKNETPYALDVNVGYADYQMNLKPDCWYPVWVTIQARSGDLQGLISIRQTENVMVSQVPFAVAEGARKRYLTYYKFDGLKMDTLEVTIEGPGLRRETLEFTQRYAAEGEQYILALDEEPGRFRFLLRNGVEAPLLLGSGDDTNDAGGGLLKGGIQGGTKVVYGDVSHLPTDPVALEGLDAVILNTPQVREMSQAQWDAFLAWMAQGGRLMLAGGGYQPFIEQSVLKDARGFAPGAPQAVPAAGIFGETAAPGSESQNWIVAWPAGVEAAGTHVELGDAAHPLIVSRQEGRGRFYYVASAFDASFIETINSRVGTQQFWPRMLDRQFAESPLDTLANKGEALTGVLLQSPFSMNLVGVGWVMKFLGLYIFLALPLNWMVCTKLKRREWAWLVAVVLALGFAGYGYSSGLHSQEKNFIANEVTLLRRAGGQATARATSFCALFSPRRYRIDLTMPELVFPARMSSNFGPSMGNRGEDQDLYTSRDLGVVYSAEGVMMRGLFFYPWSARNLRADFTVDQAGGIDVVQAVALDGKEGLSGEIVNHTGMDFTALWFMNARNIWFASNGLADGATMDLTRANLSKMTGETFFKLYADRVKNHFGGNDDGMNWQLMQAMNEMTNISIDITGFYCIGLADRSLSPLLDGMKLDKRKGLLLFEQELTNTMAKRWPLDQVTWKAVRQEVPIMANYPYMPNRRQPVTDGGTLLIMMKESLTLSPDRPVDFDSASTLSLTASIKCHPDEEYMFTGKDPKLKYRLAGFKIRLYNRGSGQWEETRLIGGEPLSLAPAGDYLDPASGEILLIPDCSPKGLFYRLGEQDGQPVEDAPVMPAGEIWDFKEGEVGQPAMVGMPEMPEMPGMPGMIGMPGMPGMPNPQFDGINIKIESVTLTNQ